MRIAIASGKGGTGKTTLSVNLASYISNEGKGVKQIIVLTDLDVEEPNSGVFIHGILMDNQNIYRSVPTWDQLKCSLCGKCSSWCNFNALVRLPEKVLVFPELCHSCYACSELCTEDALPMTNLRTGILNHYLVKDHFSFVEGKLDVGQESAVPLINQTKSYVDDHYQDDVIKIYDCPPGTSCPVIEAVDGADYVVLVTEPTPFGLHDLKLTVNTIKELGLRLGVVINRYGVGDQNVEAYCLENNIPVLGKIPNMRDAATLYSQGMIFYDKFPVIERELKKIFEDIKRTLMNDLEIDKALTQEII